MIHHEEDHSKTKFLNQNVAAAHHNGAHHHPNVAHHPMIRDVGHARSRDVGAPVSCARVTTELGVSVASATSASVKRAESLHRKVECANGYPSPQVGGAGGGGGSGGGNIAAANSSGGVSSSAVKSSRDGYREKALEEIRNSLKPYATSDAHGEGIYDFSSASSSTSESSGGVSQNVGNWANAHSSGPNGLCKNLNIQQALQHLAAIGHNEELGPYMLKVSDKCGKDEQSKSESSHNGVAKVTHANSFKYRCQQKILDVHEGVGSDNYSSQNGFRALDSNSRQDSSNVCITGLRHKIFPDPPKLIYGSSLANCEVTSNYAHNSVRQPVLDYSSSDVPPPLPPPRGTVPPPPTPPRGTPPLPPPVTIGTSIAQQEVPHCAANSITSAAQKPYLRRMSPVPASSRQVLNYTSSAGSTPQRGTSPITSGRTPMIVTNNAQIHQQLAQQLQALSVSSSSSCISSTSRNDNSVYGGQNSQNGNPSWYSSPQPSYASSSSGRHSPTPTISSSEYSIPPVFQMKRTPPPAYTPPSSYSSSPQTVPQHHSPSPAASAMMSVLPRPAALQAWSSRQAKSQSPVIMQSVKSTQVQKPVLQTAVAPTSPQTPSTSSPAFPATCQQQQAQPGVSSPPPPPYPVQKNQLTVTKSTEASPVDNKCLILPSSNTVSSHMRTIESNPPPLYPRNQNKPPSPMAGAPPASNQVTDPPPYPMPTSVVQPAVPPSPPPPPYTSAVWQGLQNPTQTSGNVVPLSFITSYSQKAMQDIPTKEVSSSDVYTGVESNQNKWSDTHQSPPSSDMPRIECCTQSSVPTTEPPSYASSMAAMMSAQRAAALMTMLNNNNNNVPSVMNSGSTSTSSSVAAGLNTAFTEPTDSSCVTKASSLVNTVESICTSQITALPGPCLNPGNANLNGMLEDPFSFLDHHHHHNTVIRKPSPVAMDTASSASQSASRSESPVSRAVNQSPVSFMSTTSTSSPSTQSDSTHESNKQLVLHKVMHQSPPPPRKILSKEKENERRETKVRNYSPAAFKFYMEQHVENVLKSHQQRERRRQQLETEMAKVGLSKEAQCEIRKMLHQKESNYIRLKRAKMNKSMFTKIKTIGIGAFGEVALVKKKDTADHYYAMKILRKSDVLKRNQVAHVKAERDILAEADNEWVVKLYYSFQDDDNLYFVMDYIPGGDLMSLLIKFGIFSEPLARFYIAELVLAVESVHKMGFIHRDIKPDNILIDRNGHIKLTDFGLCTGFRWTHNSKYYQRNGEHGRQDSMDLDDQWSNECHCKPSANLKPLERRRRREHQRCLAHSLVGTPNYIAPEVLRKTGYTQLCDWWSVGVILYEMLIGQPPFLASTSAETQLKVINWETTLRIPKKPEVSTEAADLVMKLCCCADSRLGRNGCDEIKRHPFFREIDFNSDLRRQPAPYVPEIRHAADTSNFDPIDSDKLRSSNSESSDEGNMDDPNDNKHPEHAFLEFTFRRFFDQDGGHVYPIRNNNDEPEKQSSPVYV